ncbi:hypothetical protein AJ79_02281 [Helicocarpus griseus UAMH5409]|uniref:FAD/NAD(P)-binding domain-containing protein n=1 Tax=Helicocarpus griseus UAMH5409 TaxID=1447875 RepID=A0A2B7Y4T0_9EURO|nr:hypothetical protein AJ79_02281 [Helicocarpus griseus UAMH5409]
MTITAAASQPITSFNPDALRKKYQEERDKRIQYGRTIDQYIYADGAFADYLHDPCAGPDVEREPINEKVEALVIGGGYGAQLVVINLLEEAGLKNIRMSYVYMPLLEELNYIPIEKYAHADELLEHADRIARRRNMYDMMLFWTEVHTLEWNDQRSRWTAKTNSGDSIQCQVAASTPRWDYDYTGGNNGGGLEKVFRDKRVGIIGTGASAIQIIPHLGKSAKELYIFQRTPSSIDVRANRATGLEWAASPVPAGRSSARTTST